MLKRPFLARTSQLVLLSIVLFPACGIAALAQQSRTPARTPTPNTAMSDEDREAMRDRLFSLLRLSPKLTAVLSRDPSLLGDQEYVNRINPDLAQFLQQHPEIARNPEFYLFADKSRPGMRLEQYVFPETGYHPDVWDRIGNELLPFLVFLVVFSALLWLLRVLNENRRWGKILKLQNEVHTKLLDKFSNNQELMTYMNSEAGKRFLEAAPLPAVSQMALPGKVSLARIFLPLQVGVVVFLLGVAFFALRGGVPEGQVPFYILGMLGLTLGIGFIISAGLAYFMARHLDLLPQSTAKVEKDASLAAKEQL